jgi:hypothetical protein
LISEPQRVRRIGVFMPGVADDLEFQAFNAAFLQRLAELGWIVGGATPWSTQVRRGRKGSGAVLLNGLEPPVISPAAGKQAIFLGATEPRAARPRKARRGALRR